MLQTEKRQEKYEQHVNFSLFSSITASRFWGRAIQTNDDDVDSKNEQQERKREKEKKNNKKN